jgi:hypothetical protein
MDTPVPLFMAFLTESLLFDLESLTRCPNAHENSVAGGAYTSGLIIINRKCH